jgi:hypothetical protein
VLLGLALAALCSGAPASAWTLGGRFGIEVDGLEERFQSSGLFDERVGNDGTIEQILDMRPVFSRSVTTLGLLETRIDSGTRGPASILIRNIARVGGRRARNTFRSEASVRGTADRAQLTAEWDAQGGRDEPAAGSSAFLTGTWDRSRLPLALRSQVRVAADWSHTNKKELAPILESRVLRGHLQLRRAFGLDREVRGLAGYRHKSALGSSTGSYDAWFGEIETDAGIGSRQRFGASGRVEDRAYEADTLGIPSSRLYEVAGRYQGRLTPAARPFLQQEFEWQDYRGPSEIFLDHRQWKAETGADFSLSAWRGRGDEQDGILRPDFKIRLGGQYELFRSTRSESDSLSFDSTYDSYGAIAGLAREGSDAFWFDLDLGAGRREYRNGSGSAGLVFEGLNLSLASSDYTYLRASLLLDWAPSSWIRTEALLQWDQELHDRGEDDFRLWIVNLSVTHPF